MEFAYIRKLKPFIILAMIFIFMPVLTKTGGLVPSEFYGFTVTSDDVVVIGDNKEISGWQNESKVFSFDLPLKTEYALSIDQNDNIVIYTKNARLIFTQEGSLLSAAEAEASNFEDLKNRKAIKLSESKVYVHTTDYGFINTVSKVENGTSTTAYTTSKTVILVEFAFWLGNLLLVISLIAGLSDVRKRRFLTKAPKEATEITEAIKEPKKEVELPKFLKAFQKPETYNKGAAFSGEYSTKPGERPRFTKDAEAEANTDSPATEKQEENSDTAEI